MNPASILPRRAAWLVLWFAAGSVFCRAAPSISQQIDPPEINLGDSANVTITVQNGNIPDIHLPNVEGLEVAGQSTQSGITIINGSMTSSMTVTFAVQPIRTGDFTIPAFDVATQDGVKLHVHEMKLHVLNSATAPASPV